MQSGGCGQFIIFVCTTSLSSRSFPAPAWAHSHRTQSFTKCSIEQLSRAGLVSICHSSYQKTYSMWSASTDYSSFQEPAPTWSLLQLQLPSGHVHLLWCWGLHRLQKEIHGISTGYRRMSALVPGVSHHPLCWFWCRQSLLAFSLAFSSQLCRAVFLSILMSSPRLCHCG